MSEIVVRCQTMWQKWTAPTPEVLIVALSLSLGCWGWFTLGADLGRGDATGPGHAHRLLSGLGVCA